MNHHAPPLVPLVSLQKSLLLSIQPHSFSLNPHSPRQPPVERPERRRVGADANETEARRLPAGGGTDEVPITRVRTGDSARRGVAVC